MSRDSRIRFAITWRIRAVFSTVPRLGKPRRCAVPLRNQQPEQQLQRSSSGGSSGTLSSDSSLNILLADAATNTGALDGGQVDAVVLSELTDQRGHVCFALSSCREQVSGAAGLQELRGAGSRSSSGCCRSLSNRSRCRGGRCSSSGSVADDSQNLANLCVLILGDAESRAGYLLRGEEPRCQPCRWKPQPGARQPQPARQLPSASGAGALGDGLAQCGQNRPAGSCRSSLSSAGAWSLSNGQGGAAGAQQLRGSGAAARNRRQ